jgi:hypothetical protein
MNDISALITSLFDIGRNGCTTICLESFNPLENRRLASNGASHARRVLEIDPEDPVAGAHPRIPSGRQIALNSIHNFL